MKLGAEFKCFGQQTTQSETWDLPAVAVECKTYLDKTMLQDASTAAEQLKYRNPNALYIVVADRDRRARFAFRFKRVIHLVDATIQLVARCLDWAQPRRRKAAAKCHLRLDLQTFLPRFALVDTAGEHESLRQAKCAPACDGPGRL